MKILVVSDIHANLDALDAVLSREASSCGAFMCLGDITGYGPDPEACVHRIREVDSSFNKSRTLSGNHDAALVGLISSGWFNKSARLSIERTKNALSAQSLDWLFSLPSSARWSDSVYLSHGSPVEPLTGYLWGGMETMVALSWLSGRGSTLCFVGHTHAASVFSGARSVDPRSRTIAPAPGETASVAAGPVIVNPGSVGFPRAFNGDRESVSIESYPAYFAVFDDEAMTVEFKEVRYDRRAVEERIAVFY
jgi:predicted phosphodiesterase